MKSQFFPNSGSIKTQTNPDVALREGYPARVFSSASAGLVPVRWIQISLSREAEIMEEWLSACFRCEENGCSFLLSSRLAKKVFMDFLKGIHLLFKEAVSSFMLKILY